MPADVDKRHMPLTCNIQSYSSIGRRLLHGECRLQECHGSTSNAELRSFLTCVIQM
jgi:hypothetical protein